MYRSFLPRKDADLLTWSNNFNARLGTSASTYFMSTAQVTNYAAKHDAFADALALSSDPLTRTKGKIIAKNAAKRALLSVASSYGQMISNNIAVSDEAKADIGVTIRKTEPTPITPPAFSPTLVVKSVDGNIVTVLVRGPEVNKRGLPDGVNGATLFSHIGTAPPVNINDWKFEGSTGKNKIAIEFPLSAEPFSKVFITAFFFNPAKESGPACTPISTNLGTWLVQSEAANNGDASGAQLKAA